MATIKRSVESAGNVRLLSLDLMKVHVEAGPNRAKGGGRLTVNMLRDIKDDVSSGRVNTELAITIVGTPADQESVQGHAFRIEVSVNASYSRPPGLDEADLPEGLFDFVFYQSSYIMAMAMAKESVGKLGFGRINYALDIRDAISKQDASPEAAETPPSRAKRKPARTKASG